MLIGEPLPIGLPVCSEFFDFLFEGDNLLSKAQGRGWSSMVANVAEGPWWHVSQSWRGT